MTDPSGLIFAALAALMFLPSRVQRRRRKVRAGVRGAGGAL